jgi:hypothetical protein
VASASGRAGVFHLVTEGPPEILREELAGPPEGAGPAGPLELVSLPVSEILAGSRPVPIAWLPAPELPGSGTSGFGPGLSLRRPEPPTSRPAAIPGAHAGESPAPPQWQLPDWLTAPFRSELLALELGLRQFLEQLGHARHDLGADGDVTWLWPWVVAGATAVTACELARRRLRRDDAPGPRLGNPIGGRS